MVGFGDLFGGGDKHQAYAPDLPTASTSLQKKWGEFAPLLGDLDPAIPQSIYAMDRDRVLAGKMPMSRPETARALLSAQRGETVTKSPGRNPLNVPGNALRDVRNIAASIFRLPGALIHEAESLPDAPRQLGEVLANANNPGEVVTGITQLPGVRMIPGAYTVGNVARGKEGIAELIEHPVFTGLDLLPGASKLAGATKVAKLAEAEGIAVNRPLKAVLTQKIAEDGALVRNSMGEIIDAMGRTPSGSVLKSMIGRDARAASVIKNFGDEKLVQASIPGVELPSTYRTSAEIERVALSERAARELRVDFPEIADPEWRTDMISRMEQGDFTNMDGRQLAYLGRMRDIGDKFLEYKIDKEWLGRFDNEIYPIEQANQLDVARAKSERVARKAELRRNVLDPTGTVDDHLARASAELARPGSVAERKLNATAALYAADALGADTRKLISEIRAARGAKLANVQIPATADAFRTAARADVNELLTVANRYGGRWTRLGELKQAIRDENWGAASRISRSILGNKKATIPELADFTEQLDHLRRRDRFIKRLADYDDTAAFEAAQKFETLKARTVPARYVPAIEKSARDVVIQRVTDPAKVPEVMQALVDNRYELIADVLPGGKQELQNIAQSAAKTWQDLREAGVEPVFVHRIAPNRLASLRRPRITELPRTPSAIKERTWDFSPYTHDAQIAIEAEGMELLARHGSEAFIDEMITRFGKTKEQVVNELRSRAEARAALGDSRFDYETNLERAISREYAPFNPQKAGYNWQSQRLARIADGDYYLPKYIADNLERWHNPKVTPVRALADPIMKTFRTALLPFSPRWHVNNIVGGGIVTMAEAGPTALRHIPMARKMLREGTIPEELMLRLRAQYDVYADLAILEGKSMGRWLQEAQSPGLQRAGNAVAGAGEKTSKLRELIGRAEEKSYKFNQDVDAMYRTVAYLQGKAKGAKRAMSEADQIEAGLNLADRVLPAWAEMTPLERQIMRYVFPFYAWVSYITRFALRYPFDHPLRASIMGNVTRIALDDLGEDGLPESFLNVGFFGDTDKDGNRRAFRGGAMNPFADVANAFTVLGLASSANPLISSVLEQMGYTGGRLEAYPNLRFDPETGRLSATSPGLLGSLVSNTVPQTQILTALFGVNNDFNELARTNPAAAKRSLLAAGGIPVPIRTYNIAQELAKRQQALGTEESTAKADALRSGDWTRARQFPSLASTFTRMAELEGSNTLKPYVVNPEAISVQLASLGQRASTGGI